MRTDRLQPAIPSSRHQSPVQRAQVAPTILDALGISPESLQAVRREHTEALPGLLGEE